MKSKELSTLFASHDKKIADFLLWGRSVLGVDFKYEEVWRHLAGKRGITKPFTAVYRLYFKILEESNKAENQPFKNLL